MKRLTTSSPESSVAPQGWSDKVRIELPSTWVAEASGTSLTLKPEVLNQLSVKELASVRSMSSSTTTDNPE